MEEFKRSQASSSDLLDSLKILVCVVLVLNSNFTCVHHDQQVINKVLTLNYVQKFEQVLAICCFDVKVHYIAALLAILLILIKIFEEILRLITWFKLLCDNQEDLE